MNTEKTLEPQRTQRKNNNLKIRSEILFLEHLLAVKLLTSSASSAVKYRFF